MALFRKKLKLQKSLEDAIALLTDIRDLLRRKENVQPLEEQERLRLIKHYAQNSEKRKEKENETDD
jgi:hypothetical protein|tara:strand:- start:2500 stop:2697 length:198 start_codon:yes stop_codon:yes gene_type:complete